LYGCVLDGDWMHVGDPEARDAAERNWRRMSISRLMQRDAARRAVGA
jgi:hypothetical protein